VPPASAVPPALPPAAAGKRTADEEEAAEDEDRSPHKYQKVGEDTVDEVTAAFEAEAAGDADEREDLVATAFCFISGEAIDDTDAKEWQEKELNKVIEMNTFIKTTAAEAKEKGYKIIGTRFAMNKAKGKARLVAQDVRRGPVSPEHWAPTPSTVSLRVCLLLGAAAGHGATVIDISSAFLYADLPEKDRVAVTPPPGQWHQGRSLVASAVSLGSSGGSRLVGGAPRPQDGGERLQASPVGPRGVQQGPRQGPHHGDGPRRRHGHRRRPRGPQGADGAARAGLRVEARERARAGVRQIAASREDLGQDSQGLQLHQRP